MTKTARTLAAALLFVAGTSVAQAQERPGILDALALSGSGNLTSFALSQPELPRQLHRVRAHLLAKEGFIGRPGMVMDKHISFSPVLTYDGNINGGAVGDSLVISGLRFQVREDQVSKGGILVGGGVDGGANINLAHNTALQLDFGAWAGWSPQHELSKGGVNLSACVAKQATPATRLRACARASHLEYELGKTQRASLEIGAAHAYSVTNGFNEVDLSLREERTFGGKVEDQRILSLRHTTAHRSGLTFTVGGNLGSDTDGISMRERVHASAAKIIAGRPTSIFLSAQNNRGGRFLGESRAENIFSLGLSRQVRDNLTIRVSGTKVRAKHEFFNQNSLGLDFGIRF